MKLEKTIESMTSLDYKERFKAEYYQLTIRETRLTNTIKKYYADTLPFALSCPIELLIGQRDALRVYLFLLKERAKQEGIEIDVMD